jgi:hypothetical protein
MAVEAVTQHLAPYEVDFPPSSLRRQIESEPVVSRFNFGPIQLEIRGGSDHLLVDWQFPEGVEGGEFDTPGQRWRFKAFQQEPGIVAEGMAIRWLSLFRLTSGGEIDPSTGVSFTYLIDRGGLFDFLAIAPDGLGNSLALRSGVGSLSWRGLRLWVQGWGKGDYQTPEYEPGCLRKDRLYLKQGLGLPVSRHISRAAVIAWLGLSHLSGYLRTSASPDILGMFFQEADPFKVGVLVNPTLLAETRRLGMEQVASALTEACPIGRTVFPIEPDHLAGALSEADCAVGLVLVTHPGKHWSDVPQGEAGLTEVQVLLGKRAPSKLMANLWSIISGRVEQDELRRRLKGAVAAAMREVAEEVSLQIAGQRTSLKDNSLLYKSNSNCQVVVF